MNQKTKNSFERFFEWFVEFRSSDRGQLIICFILAFLFWIPVKLEKEYTAQGNLDIRFIAPEGYVLSDKNLSDVSVNYFGNGFDILKFTLFRAGEIDIYLPDRQGDFIFRNEQLNALIREQSETELEIVSNTLEEVRIYSDLQAQKKLPILGAVEFRAKTGYVVQGDIEFHPDSAEVKGPKKIIDTISYIETVDKNIEDLSQSLQGSVFLKKHPGVQLNPEKIDFHLYVEQLTEKEIEATLQKYLTLDFEDSLLIVPPTASIKVSLPMSQYESFSEDLLTYQLTDDTLARGNIEGLSALKIKSSVPSVKVLSHEPDSVRVLKVVYEGGE